MGQRERFILFLVGAALGVALLMAFNARGNPQRDERKRVADALSLPGMYYDYAVQGKSLFGHFVLAERRTKLPAGGTRREIVTGGRNRFDADGRALPQYALLVVEQYAPGVEPAETAAVASVDFFYADRGEVHLKAGRALPAGILPADVKSRADEQGRLQVTVDPQGLKGE
ncbi:hypothetical protein EBR16_02540, partial [bacterium]|nr:hypothetical protein [bacterium]